MRQRLSEASQRLEEQNAKFDALEDKLQNMKTSNETLEKTNNDCKREISLLQVPLFLISSETKLFFVCVGTSNLGEEKPT